MVVENQSRGPIGSVRKSNSGNRYVACEPNLLIRAIVRALAVYGSMPWLPCPVNGFVSRGPRGVNFDSAENPARYSPIPAIDPAVAAAT